MGMIPDARAGFIRQRRSLLLISIALIAFQTTGATLHRIVLFGNTVDLDSPLRVTAPLWIAWFYFLARYYQYLRALGDKGIKAQYTDRFMTLAGREAWTRFAKAFTRAGDGSEMHFERGETYVVDWVGGVTFNLEGSVTTKGKAPGQMEVQEVRDIKQRIPARDPYLLWARLRAGWWVVVHTPLFTEYVLPLLVATTPLFWEGLQLFR